MTSLAKFINYLQPFHLLELCNPCLIPLLLLKVYKQFCLLMGCAACLAQTNSPTHLSTAPTAVAKKLPLLRASRLIPQQSFKQLFATVCQYITKASQNQNQSHPIYSINSSQHKKLLTAKWKLLLLASSSEPILEDSKYDSLQVIFTHSCFSAIEMDLHRTFPEVPSFQSHNGLEAFKRVLKRIALYLPNVGYTQGINFIVGFLLLNTDGFNQNQCFWMLINLALRKQFLLLGLFEDGFPLCSLFCKLFKFGLAKLHPKIHEKICSLCIPDQIWIFKWFMTNFVYSFPVEIVPQIWDYVFITGSIGMVYIAIALVSQLQLQLEKFQDQSEMSCFWTSLKDLTTFEHYIDIDEIINLAYNIKLTDKEIALEAQKHLGDIKKMDFYSRYYSLLDRPQQAEGIFQEWRKEIIQKRLIFQKTQTKTQPIINTIMSNIMKQNLKKQSKFKVKKDKKIVINLKPEINNIHLQIFGTAKLIVQNKIDPQQKVQFKLKSKTMSHQQEEQKSNQSIEKKKTQQDQIVIFELEQKKFSFKKKKPLQNNLPKKSQYKLIRWPQQHESREVLHSIENQERSVVDSSSMKQSICSQKNTQRIIQKDVSIEVQSIK